MNRIIISKQPYEDSELSKKLVKQEILSARKEKREMKVVNTKIEGLNRYLVYEKGTKELLAFFYNDRPELKKYKNLHYVCYQGKDRWYGCFGMNINPETREIKFESCSTLSYVEIDIVEDNKLKLDESIYKKL